MFELSDELSFRERVLALTLEILTSTYSDFLFQNKNLARQMSRRLPFLLVDSLNLDSNLRRRIFVEELEIVQARLARTKKFKLGLGATFTYLPGIEFEQQQDVDLSVIQTEEFGDGPVSLSADSNFDFSNRTVPGLLLSAKVPYVQLDAVIPFFSKTESNLLPVQLLDLDDTSNDALVRLTTSSELDVEYDVSARILITEVYEYLTRRGTTTCEDCLADSNSDKYINGFVKGARWYQNFELGVGLGLVGLRFRNETDIDARFGSTPGTAFEDLAAGELGVLRDTQSFVVGYGFITAALLVSDEFQVSLDARLYKRERSSGLSLDSDRFTVALRATYFPTLPSVWSLFKRNSANASSSVSTDDGDRKATNTGDG